MPQSSCSQSDTLSSKDQSKRDSQPRMKNTKQDSVYFKNIKDQLQDIQNVAKDAERTLAQLSVKNSLMVGSNKGTISTKTLNNNEEDSASKVSLFKGSSKKSTAADGADSMEQTQMTNTYLVEGQGDSKQAANSPG